MTIDVILLPIVLESLFFSTRNLDEKKLSFREFLQADVGKVVVVVTSGAEVVDMPEIEKKL